MAKIVGGTERCIRCKAKAVIWGGHVLDAKGSHVLAGWCKKHQGTPPQGWYGWHVTWMGLQRET